MTRDEIIDAILAEADRGARNMRRVVKSALEELTSEDLRNLLARARTTADVVAFFVEFLDGWAARAQASVGAAIHTTGGAVGALLAAREPELQRLRFSFDALSPTLYQAARKNAADLVREISEGQRELVRRVVTVGVAAGEGPRETARAVVKVVGLTGREEQAVANFRKELETFHLRRSASGWGLGKEIDRVNGRQVFRPGEDGSPLDGIQNRRLRDFRFDGVLTRAMESRKPLTSTQIDRMVAAYRRKSMAERAQRVARTESLKIANQAHVDAWLQMVRAGRYAAEDVLKLWVTTPDERKCATCNAIAEMNPRGVGLMQSFATPKGPMEIPPAHPHCRCAVFVRPRRKWEQR